MSTAKRKGIQEALDELLDNAAADMAEMAAMEEDLWDDAADFEDGWADDTFAVMHDMLPLDGTQTVWLFVYGTLRPGGRLSSLFRPGAVVGDPIDGVETDGALHHVAGGSRRSPIYPVADFEQEGTVVGTLLLVRPHLIHEIRQMELNVGYEERMILVRTANGVGHYRALAYHHPDTHAYGPRITSGDWRRL